MILDDIYEIPKKQRLLGLDLGTKTIGVAISDKLQTIATPLETIKRKKFSSDVEKLFEIIDRENIGAIVIGLPINMDNSEGPRCQSVRQFARNMLKLRELAIFFQDERMSSQAVAKTMDAAALSHTRQEELIDKLAAGYILQSALERMS